MRKRFGSASEETILKVYTKCNWIQVMHLTNTTPTLPICAQQVNGDGLSLALSNSDLDTLKAEIVREMRLEIQKVKNEIIDGRLHESLLLSLHI